jgi:sugar O-acyltransferase (sialic acid O-acetyltransferase NeuD family)
MTQLVIIGCSGNALDVLDVVDAINRVGRDRIWVAGLLDDARPTGSNFYGLPILGGLDRAGQLPDCVFINAVGSDRSYRLRPEIAARIVMYRRRFITLIHPAASVSGRARLGDGVLVNYGVSIGGGVRVADHVQFGPGCIVGHDAAIDDHAIVGPGAVHIGPNAYIGAGAKVRQKQRIGSRALVGIGAVVVRDVSVDSMVAGCPARVLHHSSVNEHNHSRKQSLEALPH